MVNVTGWTNLTDTSPVSAAYEVYDKAFGSGGNILFVMFVIGTTALYLRTRNITMTFIVGLVFYFVCLASGLVAAGSFSFYIMTVTLAFELAASLYSTLVG